jgi:phosphoglycerate dehydrogenase-like enzyme
MTTKLPKPIVAVLDVMPDSSREVISSAFGAKFDIVFVAEDSEAAKAMAAEKAAVLLTMWGAVTGRTIAAARYCKVIQKLGVGVDKIDVQAAERRGIVVLKEAGINADAVAELAVLLILAVARHLNATLASARAGLLAKEELRAQSVQLTGKTVGLLGLGNIGLAVARRLRPFGVSLRYHDVRRLEPHSEREHGVEYVGFHELIGTVDVLSLHLPKTPETDLIIDKDVLATVKPGLILINTARGSLIDEEALAAAVQRRQVLGAGLDVTAQEPLPADSPLRRLDRVIITPHVGGAVADNLPRVIARAYSNVTAVLGGRPVPANDIVIDPSTTLVHR